MADEKKPEKSEEKIAAAKLAAAEAKKERSHNGIAFPEVANAPSGHVTVYFDCLSGGHAEVNYCFVKKDSAAHKAYERKLGKKDTFRHRVISIT